MTKNLIASLVAAALTAAAGTAQARVQSSQDAQSQTTSGASGSVAGSIAAKTDSVSKMIQAWPSESHDAATAALNRYGAPSVASDRMLVWFDQKPFTKIVVMRDGIAHSFPTAHQDVLLEETKLAVPIDKLKDLAQFDGSLIVDRVQGTVASRADRESANILALNLANDIVSGKRDVTSARQFFADTLSKQASGKSSPYTDQLQFTVSGNTGDVGLPSSSGGDQTPRSEGTQDIGVPSTSQPGATTPDSTSPSPQP